MPSDPTSLLISLKAVVKFLNKFGYTCNCVLTTSKGVTSVCVIPDETSPAKLTFERYLILFFFSGETC